MGDQLAELRAWVAAATRIVVVGGAGVSAPSGLATYRSSGSGGAWDDPALEEKSHAGTYQAHLVELWNDAWLPRRASFLCADPNTAHLALTRLEHRLAGRGGQLSVATQNVDGLHQAAGTTGVLEVHGSLLRSRCDRTCGLPAWDDHSIDAVPLCTSCGQVARPDVVLFGEQLNASIVDELHARLRACDVCIYVGTSGVVTPICDMVSVAADAGARCVLVNAAPWRHPHPDFDMTVLGDVAQLLPSIVT